MSNPNQNGEFIIDVRERNATEYERQLLLDWLYQCGDNWALSVVEDTCAYLKHPKASMGKKQFCFCHRKQYAIGSRSESQDAENIRKDVERKRLKLSDWESVVLGSSLLLEGTVKFVKGFFRIIAFSVMVLIDGLRSLLRKKEKSVKK